MGWVQFGTHFPTDILTGIAWTSQAFSVLSAGCCLSSVGQLNFSVLCFLLFYLTVSSLFSAVHGLKPIRPLIVRFLFWLFGLPSSVCLEFPASVSLPLCNVSQEVATCLLTNWAPALPRTTVILVTLRNDSSASPTVMSDPKFHMTQPILLPNPVSHRVQSPPFDVGPPDPTVIAFIARLTCSTISPRWERFSLSSAGNVSFNVWHCSILWQTRLLLEMPPIFHWFWSTGPAC